MSDLTNFLVTAYDKPIHQDQSLSNVIKHLVGNNISIYVENHHMIDVSAWRYVENKGRVSVGKIDISPIRDSDELILIEDSILGEVPLKFPKVSKRVTKPGLVELALYYPISGENWDFNIHLRYTESLEEKDVELIKRERLSSLDYGLGIFSEVV